MPPCESGEVYCVAFSPDGRRVAAGVGDRAVVLWDARTGRKLRTFTGDFGWVFSVAFSPDDKRLATGGLEQSVKLWDTETGREVLMLGGHAGELRSVAFSPDGACLATAGLDGKVILWPGFPWDENEYPADPAKPLEDRIELYKRDYW